MPLTPSSIASREPGQSVAMQASPLAIASSNATGHPSALALKDPRSEKLPHHIGILRRYTARQQAAHVPRAAMPVHVLFGIDPRAAARQAGDDRLRVVVGVMKGVPQPKTVGAEYLG